MKKNNLSRFKGKRKSLKISIDLLRQQQQSVDYVEKAFGFPITLGNVLSDADKIAMDAALSPVLSMLKNSMSLSGVMDGMFQQFLGYGVLLGLSQDGLIRAGVEMMADEMTRKWIKLNRVGTEDNDKDGVPDLEDEMTKFHVKEKLQNSIKTSGYFGGCLVFIDTGVTDQELKEPLILDEVHFQKGSLKGFRVIEPYNVSPGPYNSTSPWKSDYYKPTYWYIQGTPIHESRLLHFEMNGVPNMLKPSYNFFGISISQMVLDALVHFTESREAAAQLLKKFSLTVLKTNMDEILSGGAGTMLDRRIDYMVQNRDNNGVQVIDKDAEDVVIVSTSLSGVTDIVRQAMEIFAAYMRFPTIKVWGISPGGLNATGESDMVSFEQRIGGFQESLLKSPLTKILKILQLNLNGKFDESLSFEFVSLSEENAEKAANIRKTDAETDAVYIESGVIDAEEARKRIINAPGSGYNDLESYVPPLTDDLEEDDEFVEEGDSNAKEDSQTEKHESESGNGAEIPE